MVYEAQEINWVFVVRALARPSRTEVRTTNYAYPFKKLLFINHQGAKVPRV
jgi:hypothetical protein